VKRRRYSIVWANRDGEKEIIKKAVVRKVKMCLLGPVICRIK
jgi:hypothetical protein